MHYLIWPNEAYEIPNYNQAKKHLEYAHIIHNKAPHLLKLVKRNMSNRSFSFLEKVFIKKDYPFKNGQQAATRNHIVWDDYEIQSWPLLLFVLKELSGSRYKEIIATYFDDNKCPRWDRISNDILCNAQEVTNVELDELDRWYDEISATHISPSAYNMLYSWFGYDLRNIGYDAFDYFMTERDGERAWQMAIEKHLQSISNLPQKDRQQVLDNILLNIIIK